MHASHPQLFFFFHIRRCHVKRTWWRRTAGVGRLLRRQRLPELDDDALDREVVREADVAAAVVDPLDEGGVVGGEVGEEVVGGEEVDAVEVQSVWARLGVAVSVLPLLQHDPLVDAWTREGVCRGYW